MKLHEYQAKALFKEYGIPVPDNIAVNTPEQARLAAEQLSTDKVVVKVQIHAGGRSKAGGIKLVDTPREAEDYAQAMLGASLVTTRTDEAGQPVNTVLVETMCDVATELYLGLVVDEALGRVVLLVSAEGGMQIDRVVTDSPEKILHTYLDPVSGLLPDQSHELGLHLGLTATQIGQFTQLLSGVCQMFADNELSLLEINPLVITVQGEFVCLDGKVIVDDTAVQRHPTLLTMRNTSHDVEPDSQAVRYADLDYSAIKGNIGLLTR